MATNRETLIEEEKKIPVFTVLKKGAVFKNIFLLDKPIDCEGPRSYEEVLIVGRHPDCNIMLEHPSISRFHLEIRSKPLLQRLSVVDLSSAHGTWVSERKIEPQIPVELIEGDTLRLGASTRVYKLHWMLISRAYDIENPFISQILEDELRSQRKEAEEEEFQNENQFSILREQRQVPSAPPMPESMNFSFIDGEDNVYSDPQLLGEKETRNVVHIASESGNSSLFPAERVPFGNQQNPVENFSIYALSESEDLESPPIRSEKKSDGPSIWSRRGKSASEIKVQTGRSKGDGAGNPKEIENETVSKILFPVSSKEEETLDKESFTPNLSLRVISVRNGSAEEEIFNPDKENFSPNYIVEGKSEKSGRMFEKTFSPDKENSTPNRLVGAKSTKNGRLREEIFTPEEYSTPKSLLGAKSDKKSRVEEEIFTPDKENFTPKSLFEVKSRKGKMEEIQKGSPGSFCISEKNSRVGEEIFTPDKENFTPNRLFEVKSQKSRMEEIKQRSSGSLSSDHGLFSEKENLTPIVIRHSKSKKTASASRVRQENEMILSKRKAGRVPFQSLFSNSNSKTKSEVSLLNIPTRSSNSVNCGRIKEKNSLHSLKHCVETNKWNMVVDTNCLLDKDSRRSLQLLQGLKGTHLIIPRMVIRELDCLKRRGSLFRRETDASLILQWIEECMVTTKWWIHVQNSLEEGLPVAPTPPASPESRRLSEGSFTSSGFFPNSLPFSPRVSLMEVASPTAGDHTLECALLFKRLKNDENLIILSNDVALKIKAMAEGLICETAEEFRDSLVNTGGKRFLYLESTPRGPTWSCVDEAGLRENYYHFPVKKTLKGGEGVRGLKLILHHNSHYGQLTSVN